MIYYHRRRDRTGQGGEFSVVSALAVAVDAADVDVRMVVLISRYQHRYRYPM